MLKTSRAKSKSEINLKCNRLFVLIFMQSLKKVGYMLMAMGCSGYLYFWTYITRNIMDSSSTILFNYWPWIMGYFIISAIVSFAVCYRYGPLTEPRTLNLIKWMLQFVALVFIYNGTQILEASIAIIVTLLTLYNIPPSVFDNRFTRFIRYVFCFVFEIIMCAISSMSHSWHWHKVLYTSNVQCS